VAGSSMASKEPAPPAVADAFCASRLDHDWAPTFGTLPAGADVAAIIEYARLRRG
jgi:putative acyl-CoA dehydrogenase